jgi:hypothetical protein
VASNRAAGLEKIIAEYSEKQSNALEDTLGFISNVMGTLAVGQLTSRFFIQDPFQYDTVPALQAMGQTGDAGAMLSEALMAEAQYDASLNQTAFGIGTGAIVGGTAMFARGNVLGGLATGAFGALAAAGGISGNASDFLQNIGIAQDDIVETQLARQVVDAGRVSDLYTSSRAGLLQVGAGPNLGFSGSASGGNAFLENLVTGREAVTGMTLREMGVSSEEAGRRLSAASMQLRGRDEALSQAVETTGVMETLFGMDAGTSLGVLSSIQRAGVNPDEYVNTFYQSMGAVSDETGYVSGFAANVLVPALNQVLESTSIQNASRSAEELTREVYGFRQTLAGNDRLGELIDANPEVYSGIYANMQQTIKQGAQDPATLGFYRSLGLSYEEIYSGSPEVAVRTINSFRSLLRASGMAMTEENVLPIASTLARTGLGGIPDGQQMANLLVRQDDLEIGDLRSAVSGESVGGRSEEDLSDDLQSTLELLAEGRDEMDKQIVGAVDVITDMQRIVTDFIASDRFDTMIMEGIDNIQREFYDQMGIENTRSALFESVYADSGARGNALVNREQLAENLMLDYLRNEYGESAVTSSVEREVRGAFTEDMMVGNKINPVDRQAFLSGTGAFGFVQNIGQPTRGTRRSPSRRANSELAPNGATVTQSGGQPPIGTRRSPNRRANSELAPNGATVTQSGGTITITTSNGAATEVAMGVLVSELQ